jgi:hypothetical protein
MEPSCDGASANATLLKSSGFAIAAFIKSSDRRNLGLRISFQKNASKRYPILFYFLEADIRSRAAWFSSTGALFSAT